MQELGRLLAGRKKSPTLAFVYALVPGTFCIMGMGHFYTRRYVKGAFLLVGGFMLGLLAWASAFGAVARLGEPSFADYLLVSLIFVAPFAALMSWSAFDAAKQARFFNARALTVKPRETGAEPDKEESK